MSRALIITGMHRSGTSLLASAVLRAGVDLGSSFLPAGRGNWRGHFEDLDFYCFHEDCLKRRKLSPFAVPHGWDPELTSAEEEEARDLVARRAEMPLWGFKDPRASLFLDLWDRHLPEPLYLLVYRNPVEVALSLLRRGLDQEILEAPRNAFQAWMVYNERLLAFREAHPDRCLLWHVNGMAGSLEAALERLQERLDVPLRSEGAGSVFHPEELIGLQKKDLDWSALLPEAFDLYRRLEAAADLPGADSAAVSAVPGPVKELFESNEILLATALRPDPGSVRRIREQEQEIRELRERLEEARAERAAIESSRAWRAVRRYWNAVLRVRALVRSDPEPAAPAAPSSLQDREAALRL